MGEIKKDVHLGNPQSRVIDVGKRRFIKKRFFGCFGWNRGYNTLKNSLFL